MSALRPLPFLLLLALLGIPGPARGEDLPPPNLIYVLADDLGYGELGCFGQTKIKTPRLDRMAKEGMAFTQHYSGSPVCAPSRCVLLTGLHTGHAAIRDNDEMGHRGDVWSDPALEGQRPLPAGTVTLAHLLKKAGYATGAIGKWGLGWTGSSGDPNAMGFDTWVGVVCQRVAHDHYPTHLWKNGERVPLSNAPRKAHQKLPAGADPSEAASYVGYAGTDYSMDRLTEEALAFIKAHKDHPFFLYLPYLVPHVALQVPADSLKAYEGVFEETPYVGDKGYLPHRTPRAAYAAMITRLDRDVGRILDLVDALGLGEQTVVVFSSDNGPSWVGGVDPEFFRSSGGLRGRKAQLFEGGIRVPMVVRYLGVVPRGTTSRLVSGFQDVMPTFLELANVEIPEGLDGLSLVPTLIAIEEMQDEHPYLYWEHGRCRQAIRKGRWKAYRPKPSAPIQLYDLEADPSESKDVVAAHPGVVKELEALFESARTESEHFPLKRD